jgi:hypothetical protein
VRRRGRLQGPVHGNAAGAASFARRGADTGLGVDPSGQEFFHRAQLGGSDLDRVLEHPPIGFFQARGLRRGTSIPKVVLLVVVVHGAKEGNETSLRWCVLGCGRW